MKFLRSSVSLLTIVLGILVLMGEISLKKPQDLMLGILYLFVCGLLFGFFILLSAKVN